MEDLLQLFDAALTSEYLILIPNFHSSLKSKLGLKSVTVILASVGRLGFIP